MEINIIYCIYINILQEMPRGNPFKRSNNARMLNSAAVNRNQGGGSKKAGLPPTAVLPAAVWIAYNTHHYPRTARQMAFTLNPNVRPSRPIDTRPANYRP